MIVSMFQAFMLHDDSWTKMNLGQLLIRFFHLYGWEIDYALYQINPIESEKIEKIIFDFKDEMKMYKPYQPAVEYAEKLTIIDPTNAGNNVGRCTYKINAIKVKK